jgi:hypothetical protein
MTTVNQLADYNHCSAFPLPLISPGNPVTKINHSNDLVHVMG